MEISQETRDDRTIVRVRGEVDMRSSPELRRVLLSTCSLKKKHVVIDLGEVLYIDSSGIATLVECMKNCGRHQSRLILVNVNDRIRGIFELAQLHKVFDIRTDGSLG